MSDSELSVTTPRQGASLRIVSLVPSLTHMLCDFGLRGSLVGVTKFCVAPPGLRRHAALVGGTKDPDIAAIAALQPTHILANTEENKPEHIAACRELAPTFVCFPKRPRELIVLLAEIAQWLGIPSIGAEYATELTRSLAQLEDRLKDITATATAARRYLYLIWREPYMLAGHDTYIEAMLALLGWENAAPRGTRYPEMTIPAMREAAPDLLLLSSEPYPFRVRDAERLRAEWPGAPRILKVDGQLCSWYGTMTATAVDALTAWVSTGGDGIFSEFKSHGPLGE